MEKAKFIGKYRYRQHNEDCAELEYEYRGRRYTIDVNYGKGNEPLAWQHRNAQERIDALIEREKAESRHEKRGGPYIDEALEDLFDYWNS